MEIVCSKIQSLDEIDNNKKEKAVSKKGSEHYGGFSREVIGRTDLRNGIYHPDIRRNSHCGICCGNMVYHGGADAAFHLPCQELKSREPWKETTGVGDGCRWDIWFF